MVVEALPPFFPGTVWLDDCLVICSLRWALDDTMAIDIMVFTSFRYIFFLAGIACVYWWLGERRKQNLFLLAASYVFYGWVHPWFCILIAVSTLVDYFCGLAMSRHRAGAGYYLAVSLFVNLGLLGFFKYYDFFVENVRTALGLLGIPFSSWSLGLLLPVGISFYTFQTLSYTIDIYRGRLEAREDFVDFALFVSFFPQLVAGPIERARRFLPQIERERHWSPACLHGAWPLLLSGYLKKMVIAENLAPYVDKVFMLSDPGLLLLAAGVLAFAFQIYTDFSGYTDIARGSARLLGFELMENFRSPYLAVSPSDFWRRWHISFSSWIRDYLYIPLGGSRVKGNLRFIFVLVVSLGLSGLWHGASWHFVLWGIYHAFLVFAWHRMGLGGRWQPSGLPATLLAWSSMFVFTLIGWALFRAPNLAWLAGAAGRLQPTEAEVATSAVLVAMTVLYASPLSILALLERRGRNLSVARGAAYAFILLLVVVFGHDRPQDFIYFRF